MSDPEGYRKIGKYAAYFVDVHSGGDIYKRVGIGTRRYPEITLDPADALLLLDWLSEQQETLERLAQECEP